MSLFNFCTIRISSIIVFLFASLSFQPISIWHFLLFYFIFAFLFFLIQCNSLHFHWNLFFTDHLVTFISDTANFGIFLPDFNISFSCSFVHFFNHFEFRSHGDFLILVQGHLLHFGVFNFLLISVVLFGEEAFIDLNISFPFSLYSA